VEEGILPPFIFKERNMALNEFSLKELYDVKLKATYPIEIGDRRIKEGETICYFDSI
jgi:hypothetical protein